MISLRVSATNLANTNQLETPRGFSKGNSAAMNYRRCYLLALFDLIVDHFWDFMYSKLNI